MSQAISNQLAGFLAEELPKFYSADRINILFQRAGFSGQAKSHGAPSARVQAWIKSLNGDQPKFGECFDELARYLSSEEVVDKGDYKKFLKNFRYEVTLERERNYIFSDLMDQARDQYDIAKRKSQSSKKTRHRGRTARFADDSVSDGSAKGGGQVKDQGKLYVRPVYTDLVAERLSADADNLVELADALLDQIDEFLRNEDWRRHNLPQELGDEDPAREVRRLRETLFKFREAIFSAATDNSTSAEEVANFGGNLVSDLKVVFDHPIVQRPALGAAGVAVSALALAAGVPVDPTIVTGIIVVGSDFTKGRDKS